ncbi:MAG: polysaccharide deacetylase family protein [Muribaculaceae bacterium]|nr:polysaccharide deacetylase family protein [Muribaculaceae bacterium]
MLYYDPIARPPRLYRIFFPGGVWRLKRPAAGKTVFLTFDDGPVPEETPWVLDTLDRYGIKATFFMVGDNVRRYPGLLEEVRRRGHSVGNHTMHHLQGIHHTAPYYLADVAEAHELIGSRLFRPPHGLLKPAQSSRLRKHYRLIMYDLVTRDYSSSLTPEQVLERVCRYARNGSIIVFHDSIKASPRMRWALPRAIEWLMQQGYEFDRLPE